VKLPNAVIAGVQVDITDPDAFAALAAGFDVGDLKVTMGPWIPARVDIFGVNLAGNLIVNSAANSGSAGVIPEPHSTVLFGAGALIVGWVLRKRRLF
jgi:hypothetical protein